MQVLGALLYKSAMWYLYVGELAESTKQRNIYKIAEWISNCYALECLLDIVTVILFVWATLKLFVIFTV